MEFEIRARVNNPVQLRNAIQALSDVTTEASNVHEIDTYLKHEQDKERKLVIRIRRKDSGAVLSFKARTSKTKDVLWQDIDILLPEPDQLEQILTSSGYEEVVIVDKVRDYYKYGDYEINVDQVKSLGDFVEIAYESEEIVDSAERLKEMKEILAQLGCKSDDIEERGYVPLLVA